MARRAPDLVLSGHFDRSDEKRYVHIPFEVPPGVRQLHLRCSYTDRISADPLVTGGNTLDLGLFDERGIAPGSRGFRGWSGSERLELTIDQSWATPPYAAGPIAAGRWHVLLGPYKLAPRGCAWRIDVWFDLGVRPEERPTRRPAATRPALPPPAEPGWVRGDLHCHTVFSDGDSWPAEMIAAAIAQGLDFLGVTDHNQVAHHAEYGEANDDRLLLLPGVEVTTYGGHWNAWGVDRWFEFREPTASAVESAIRDAVARGALVSVCHPKPLGPPWEYPTARGYHAIEVWNGPWDRANPEALRFWEEHLRRGERVVALGGSDTHRLRTPDPDPRHAVALGRPTTWVRVEGRRDAASVLDALRAGRAFVSASPAGPQLYLEARGGEFRARVVGAARGVLALASDQGHIDAAAIDRDDWERSSRFPEGARYVRAQITDSAGSMLAVSNPLWLDAGS